MRVEIVSNIVARSQDNGSGNFRVGVLALAMLKTEIAPIPGPHRKFYVTVAGVK